MDISYQEIALFLQGYILCLRDVTQRRYGALCSVIPNKSKNLLDNFKLFYQDELASKDIVIIEYANLKDSGKLLADSLEGFYGNEQALSDDDIKNIVFRFSDMILSNVPEQVEAYKVVADFFGNKYVFILLDNENAESMLVGIPNL